MSLAGAVTAGLYGATLLARGRSDGLRYVEADFAGAARSFAAIVLCLPAVISLRLMNWLQTGLPAHAGHSLGLDMLTFLVGWLGFALLTFHLAPVFGYAPRWPRFIGAWNWCNVVENLLLMLGAIPGLLGAPPVLDEAAQIIAFGWAVWIEWFAAREALGCSRGLAVGVVVLDLLISSLLEAVSVMLLGN